MALKLAHWRSEAGRGAYLRAYDKALTLWPVPFESRLIPTRFGETHAVVSGPEDAPPILFLPAAIGTGALQWFPNATRLTKEVRMCALDFVGAPGRGTQTAPLADRADYARWLVDVVDGLGIEHADIVGSSQGGWMTLNVAIAEPSRVRSIALLAPAASFLPFRKPIEWMIRIGPWLPAWTAGPTIKVNFGADFELDDRFVRVAELALQHFRYQERALIPDAFSDGDLRGIKPRVLVMIGDHERIYDPADALQRATELVPGVETDFVAGAGHLINMEQAEHADAKILQFLKVPE